MDQRGAQALVAQQGHGVGLAVGGLVPFKEALVVFAAARHVLQVHELGAAHLGQQALVIGQAHVHLHGDFRFHRAAPELLFQALHGFLDVFLAFACAAAHPVVVTQFVEHGAADALRGKGLELRALGSLVTRQRVVQADHPHLDQVIELHIGRQLGDHVVRKAAHQRSVLLEQGVAIELAFGGVSHFNHFDSMALGKMRGRALGIGQW